MPDRAILSTALLAPEMASHGGVQSYMWLLHEALQAHAEAGNSAAPALWSLNDSAAALRAWRPLPAGTAVRGGQRHKVRFSLGLLADRLRPTRRPVDWLVVGHLGLSPLAHWLQRIGQVRRYSVVLHGFEAWLPLGRADLAACQAADCIVATTPHTAQRFAACNAVEARRLRVLPLCAQDAAPADPQFRLAGAFKLLAVGRMSASERYKGFDELIAATRLLHDQGVPVALHLVGQGDDQARLVQLARDAGVQQSVTFHGALAGPALQAAYAQCDVFALPSANEGFGIVFVEAMRHAKPCVGAAAGGTPAVVRQGVNGLLVEPGRSAPLAQALQRLWADTTLRGRLGAAGQAMAADEFSKTRFIQRHLALMAPTQDPPQNLPQTPLPGTSVASPV